MCQSRLSLINRVPRGCGLQFVVDVVDVPHALGFKPLPECRGALLGIDRDTIFPGGASTKDAVEPHARFSRKLERLAEFRVADPGRKINEWLGRDVSRCVEQVDGFLL